MGFLIHGFISLSAVGGFCNFSLPLKRPVLGWAAQNSWVWFPVGTQYPHDCWVSHFPDTMKCCSGIFSTVSNGAQLYHVPNTEM